MRTNERHSNISNVLKDDAFDECGGNNFQTSGLQVLIQVMVGNVGPFASLAVNESTE
jgi:hypothetical protein